MGPRVLGRLLLFKNLYVVTDQTMEDNEVLGKNKLILACVFFFGTYLPLSLGRYYFDNEGLKGYVGNTAIKSVLIGSVVFVLAWIICSKVIKKYFLLK